MAQSVHLPGHKACHVIRLIMLLPLDSPFQFRPAKVKCCNDHRYIIEKAKYEEALKQEAPTSPPPVATSQDAPADPATADQAAAPASAGKRKKDADAPKRRLWTPVSTSIMAPSWSVPYLLFCTTCVCVCVCVCFGVCPGIIKLCQHVWQNRQRG